MFGLFKKSLPGPVEAEAKVLNTATKAMEKTFSEFEDEIMEEIEKAEQGPAQKAETPSSTPEVLEPEYRSRRASRRDLNEKAQASAPPRRFVFSSQRPDAPQVAPPVSTLSKYRDIAFGGPFTGTHAAPAAAVAAVDPDLDGQVGFSSRRGAAAPPPAPAQGQKDTSALNPAVVQAVELQNREVKEFAPTMIATPPDQMIGQAAGLAAQSAAQYFDSMTKLVMASQSSMLKRMATNVAEDNLWPATKDGIAIAETELLLAGAMAVAAAGGALEAKSAAFGIQQLNESVAARTGGNSSD